MELVNLLDDGLTTERAKGRDISSKLIERFVDLVHYAHRAGADGDPGNLFGLRAGD